jgi:hypothetical protein
MLAGKFAGEHGADHLKLLHGRCGFETPLTVTAWPSVRAAGLCRRGVWGYGAGNGGCTG